LIKTNLFTCGTETPSGTGYNGFMEEPVIRKLLSINLEFYQTFAATFSATRSRLQPGVQRILDRLPTQINILEVGCGNGELARMLMNQGHRGVYIGLDFSSELLEIARASLTSSAEEQMKSKDGEKICGPPNCIFLQLDITSAGWEIVVRNQLKSSISTERLNMIFAFSTLHHLPGKTNQYQTLTKFHNLLEDGGLLLHSNWQFLNSEKLRKRILPWSTIGIKQEDVDDGDYLLDWRRGGYGVRYVHHFNKEELSQMASRTGFQIVDSFLSDGEGGKLGLYQVWKKVSVNSGVLGDP
jgi:SAM-dependent methyltransferase